MQQSIIEREWDSVKLNMITLDWLKEVTASIAVNELNMKMEFNSS